MAKLRPAGLFVRHARAEAAEADRRVKARAGERPPARIEAETAGEFSAPRHYVHEAFHNQTVQRERERCDRLRAELAAHNLRGDDFTDARKVIERKDAELAHLRAANRGSLEPLRAFVREVRGERDDEPRAFTGKVFFSAVEAVLTACESASPEPTNSGNLEPLREASEASDQLARALQLAERLRTQDNRCTHLPVFMVQRQVRDVGLDADYAEDVSWFHCDDQGEFDKEESDRLEAHFQETGESPEEFIRTGWRVRWENVQPFLTEDGAKEYLRLNGHNLGKTRIYVESGYRNGEWEFVRELLLALGREACPLRSTTTACESASPEPANRWQPIATAPKDGTWIVLGFKNGGHPCIGLWHPLHECWWSSTMTFDADQLHWAPLPTLETP